MMLIGIALQKAPVISHWAANPDRRRYNRPHPNKLHFFPYCSLPSKIIFPLYAGKSKKCAGFSLTEGFFFGTILEHTHP